MLYLTAAIAVPAVKKVSGFLFVHSMRWYCYCDEVWRHQFRKRPLISERGGGRLPLKYFLASADPSYLFSKVNIINVFIYHYSERNYYFILHYLRNNFFHKSSAVPLKNQMTTLLGNDQLVIREAGRFLSEDNITFYTYLEQRSYFLQYGCSFILLLESDVLDRNKQIFFRERPCHVSMWSLYLSQE